MSINYMGIYHRDFPEVFKVTDQGRKALPLRLEVRNLASLFSWGTPDAGAVQLAIALLHDACGRAIAEQHFPAFRAQVIAGLKPGEDWQMSRADILAWREEHEAPERSQREAYQDSSYPMRECIECGRPYQGPTEFCSGECDAANANHPAPEQLTDEQADALLAAQPWLLDE